MKKLVCSLLVIVVLAGFKLGDGPIIGRWELKGMDKGQPFSFLLVFRPNGIYDGFLNKKTFISGTYHMRQDTMYIADPICNSAYEGIYRIQYLGKNDSLTFHLVKDSCRARQEGTIGFTFKNIKKP